MQLTITYSDFMRLLCEESRKLVKSLVPEQEVGADAEVGDFYSGWWGEPSQKVYYFTETMPITQIANAEIFEKRIGRCVARIEFWELRKEDRIHDMVVFTAPSLSDPEVLRLKDSLTKDGIILYKKKAYTFELCGFCSSSKFRNHTEQLLSQEDSNLFLEGGCHVFALALHEQFHYPFVLIRDGSEKAPKGIVHVYCCLEKTYAVDFLGTRGEKRLLRERCWDVPGYVREVVGKEHLEDYFVERFGGGGLYGEPCFLEKARIRATRCIVQHLQYYSGKLKCEIW